MLRNTMRTLVLVSLLFFGGVVSAQRSTDRDSLKRLGERVGILEEYAKRLEGSSVSGYIQLYYQGGQRDAQLSVGTAREGDVDLFTRLGVRRGRIKLSYTKGIASAVFQVDMTEKGIALKDAYLRFGLPFLGESTIDGGLLGVPFGHELRYSTVLRETPERSMIVRTLFPNERDLGALLTLSGAKGSLWNKFRLDLGLFSGGGVARAADSRVDLSTRLSARHDFSSTLAVGLGTSLYYGHVYQPTNVQYRIDGTRFVRDVNDAHVGAYARRSYFGVDAQLHWRNALGKTELRAEWLAGQQPSLESRGGQRAAMYLRPIAGAYVMLAQGVGRTPLSLVAKYDWFDQNTALSGDAVGRNYSGAEDLAYHTLGFGANYQLSDALRLTLYGEQVWNERTASLVDFKEDRKDSRVTLGLLYRF